MPEEKRVKIFMRLFLGAKMKHFVLLLSCLLLILSGCALKGVDSPEIETSENIKAVLRGEKDFKYSFILGVRNDEPNKPERGIIATNIHDFKYYWCIDELEDGSLDLTALNEFNFKWLKWATIDLDRDGINEVIYLVSPGGDGLYIIFHEIDGEVYGYSVPYRDIDRIYEDGTIMGAGGASSWWYEKIKSFKEEEILSERFAWAYDNQYIIDGKEVDEDEFRGFMSKLDENTQLVKWIPNERD